MGTIGAGVRARAALGGVAALLIVTVAAVQTSTAGAVTANLVAVGDMNGCTSDGQPTGSRLPADLVADLPGDLAVLGDAVQSQVTTLEQYERCYDPAWGRFNDRVRPAPGNHDYREAGATGYFDYFGGRAGGSPLGSYTYSAGDWDVFAVNSNCDAIGGCGPGSPVYQWLASALAASSARCQVAYWHHPRWSQGQSHGNDPELGPLFSLLYDARVELLLSGHDHAYQRFPALNPSGAPAAEGVTQFVVGTGGASRYGFTNSSPAAVVRDNTSYGVVALELTATGWTSRFVPEAGASFQDSASGTCRAAGDPGPSTSSSSPSTTGPVPTTDTQEPNSTIAVPSTGSTVGSSVVFSGVATDDVGVDRVRVSVRNQVTNQWLQENGTSFGSTFRQVDAILGSRGDRSTTWSLPRTLPNGSYGVGARAVDNGGRVESVTPWVTFSVSGSSPTTAPPTTAPPTTAPPTTAPPTTAPPTTAPPTTAPPTTAPPTTVAPGNTFDDQWAFWGYLYSDGRRLANGTWRFDQAPLRYAASAQRFVRGAQALGYTVRIESSGAYVTNQSIASLPDPRTAGAAAVRAFLTATIEDEATCVGLVYDNPQLSVVQYVQNLYTAAGVPTRRVTYSGGFNELYVDQPNWGALASWPFATTVRTPGASNCTVYTK